MGNGQTEYFRVFNMKNKEIQVPENIRSKLIISCLE